MIPFTHVYFDCDSTLVRAESLDLLAARRGVTDEVREMTERSMNGDIPFEEVIGKKLAMIAPSKEDVEALCWRWEDLLVDGAREVVQALRSHGMHVGMLTSNFHPIADPIADLVGIPREHVVANDLYFDDHGQYVGFNESHPLAKSNGKELLIQTLSPSPETTAMIGDGASDLACKPHIGLFVGFGGVAMRARVRDGSDVYIEEPSLRPVLPYLLATNT